MLKVRWREPGESQEDYCKDCVRACNVILSKKEACLDRMDRETGEVSDYQPNCGYTDEG